MQKITNKKKCWNGVWTGIGIGWSKRPNKLENSARNQTTSKISARAIKKKTKMNWNKTNKKKLIRLSVTEFSVSVIILGPKFYFVSLPNFSNCVLKNELLADVDFFSHAS